MDISNIQQGPSTDHETETQRAVIRLALNDISDEVGVALRDADLGCPVYLTVPNSGDSVATMATPVDPSDEDWAQISAIVCGVIAKRLDDIELRGRPVICVMANATMGAADITADLKTEA